ncbi:uncharacterized protein K460DRAFT_392287 [Cucurbitaria berberidis CBS 394.84]|uniref:C3H1-type domain-containing protein n=1 Tax=Cucurbitaria berberidis CBS 394.84 TaxID=1168544 RepID=A0A9P4GUP9_9PLEO|nr:uncharacterized protein K460DRAFT_392287 [Cucurbitaria berberidis CBS 394.84]KAF1852167.1 hypothetical protein K460DRAFT_392287 [Cucurbitaria berberidis CBS 394.84]
MAGSSSGKLAPKGQSGRNSQSPIDSRERQLTFVEPKQPTGQESLHDQLMRELDDRDALLAREAANASQGLQFARLPLWGVNSVRSAAKFGDVWERYQSQRDQADELLVPSKPSPESTLDQLNRLIDETIGTSSTQPEVDTQTAQSNAPPGPTPPASNSIFDMDEMLGFNRLNLDRPAIPHSTPTRGDRGGRGAPDTRSDRGGIDNGRGGGGGGGGFTHPSQSPTYPKIWSRWMNCSEAKSLISNIDQADGMQTGLRVYKLEPNEYGGDVFHDLGLCKAHHTKGKTCPLSWESCPYRHWAIDQIEEQWVKPSWLAQMRQMGRRPFVAPDNAHTRYQGLSRQFASGVWFQSSCEKFPEVPVAPQLATWSTVGSSGMKEGEEIGPATDREELRGFPWEDPWDKPWEYPGEKFG